MEATPVTALERGTSTQSPSANTVAPTSERVAVLEERSLHAATQAQLHRVALALFLGIVGTLGGLILHLHNQQIALIEKLFSG